MKIYNTLTDKKEEFVPVNSGKVTMYVCGPTVYNYFHIGNARPFIVFDTFRNYLKYKGFKVIYVQNITDVDDKIINKAKEENTTFEKVAEKYTKAYFDDIEKLKIEKLNKFEELLLHKLFIFPLTIERAVKKLDSTLIAKYAYDLCKAFNDFYENCNIIKADFDEKEKRLALLVRYINILEDCFFILGLHSLEKI